jgi:hypothetical protein
MSRITAVFDASRERTMPPPVLWRAVRLRGLHGDPSERGRHQHRCRVHSFATSGTWWPGLVNSQSVSTADIFTGHAVA